MEHLVFVYGTLKQGYPNFHINHGRRLAGEFITVERHALLVLGPDWLPWLLPTAGQGERVTGEVYAVDDAGLARMDRLEQIDEPGWYLRRRIAVVPKLEPGAAPIEPWVYFGHDDRPITDTVHLGPLAEYTLEHAKTYREGS